MIANTPILEPVARIIERLIASGGGRNGRSS
jgi:hypothetical protein